MARLLEDCMEALIDYRGKTPQKTTSGIPLITAKVVKGGRIETPDEFIAADDYEPWMRRGVPRPGDVVITTEAPLGEVAQLGTERVALAQRLIALRGKSDILDNGFLKFLLQSEAVQDQLRARASGTTVLGIKQSELRKILLTFPALPEQRAIVHILGTLDDKVELNRRMNDTLEAIARAIFKSRFSGSVEDSDLEDVPAGWRVGTVLDVADLMSGGTPKTSEPAYWDGPIPWASAKDVSQCGDIFLISTERSITERGVNDSSTQVIPAFSTAVVARGATTGRNVVFGRDIAMNQTCYALRSRLSDHWFLFCWFREQIDRLVHAGHGSVFNTITTTTFHTNRVAIPSDEERLAFDRVVAPLFGKILATTAESRTLAAIRDALLPKLISGEIRVKGADKIVEKALG